MMYRFFAFFWCLLLMVFHSNMALEEPDLSSISYDLHKLEANCEADNCASFFKHQKETLFYPSCHCGVQCVRFGTCCLDSPYSTVQQPKLKPVCTPIYESGSKSSSSYFMMNECHPDDTAWASLCHEGWNGDNDLQKLVPVTSLLSHITYKNYYCFRCFEAGHEFLYWRVKLESEFDVHNYSVNGRPKLSNKELSITYDNDAETWMASYEEDIGKFPVNFSLEIPYKIQRVTQQCLLDVISDCADEWMDEDHDEIHNVRKKCQGYMALKEVNRNNMTLTYKNLHCALCNFENVTDASCRQTYGGYGGDGGYSGFGYSSFDDKPFTFAYLLDINRLDGELVGKVQRCTSDQVWDPFTKKCRKLKCALPEFKLKDGKCVQE